MMASDKQTGIAIRFVKEWDIVPDTHPINYVDVYVYQCKHCGAEGLTPAQIIHYADCKLA